jgi:hypothetical protein
MPIPDTKYNFNTKYNYSFSKLKYDISNNSFVYSNHILTCDLSDTLINNNSSKPNKPNNLYLTSKAAFLIHPFSNVSNCNTQFSSTNNLAFQYKKPLTSPINGVTSHNAIQIQKEIQDQLHTSSSNYTQVLSSLSVAQDINKSNTKAWHNASDRSQKKIGSNYGVDIKHNSYDRYLAKKKSTTLKTQNSQNSQPNPLQGNKTKYYSLITQNNNCTANC